MAANKGQPKVAGRKKGSLNKFTVELKAAFQEHGDALVKALIALTESDDEKVQLGAIKECFDRGWGRPPQAVQHTGSDGGPIETRDVTREKIVSEVERLFTDIADDEDGGEEILH